MRKLQEKIKGCEYSEEYLFSLFESNGLSEYKELMNFYKINSGQVFRECQYGEYKITGWFNIKPRDCEIQPVGLSFEEIFELSREYLPEKLIPFAYNSQNDFYLISDRSEVYFIRNDMIYVEDGAMERVADNFTSFINQLRESELPGGA